MKLYVVTCEGIYRQEIKGVFDTEEKANKVAIEALKNEPDEYHHYNVSSLVLGEAVDDVELIHEYLMVEGKKWKGLETESKTIIIYR